SFPFYFLFSSRRRHTRFSRDWSSDVCSSDLLPVPSASGFTKSGKGIDTSAISASSATTAKGAVGTPASRTTRFVIALSRVRASRSEERRVGKEGGSRRAAQTCRKADGTTERA